MTPASTARATTPIVVTPTSRLRRFCFLALRADLLLYALVAGPLKGALTVLGARHALVSPYAFEPRWSPRRFRVVEPD